MEIPKNNFDVKSFEEKKIEALTIYWVNNMPYHNSVYLGGLSRFRFSGRMADIPNPEYDFCPTQSDMEKVCSLFKERGYYCYVSKNKAGISYYSVHRKPMNFTGATLM